MSLWNGIDYVAAASEGVYTEGYISATGGGAIANLAASFGLLEDAPEPPTSTIKNILAVAWRTLYRTSKQLYLNLKNIL